MTERKKPVRIKWGMPGSKVKRTTAMTVFSSGARRPVVVSIYPDGMIGLRLHKHRREEFMCADVMYRQAVIERKVYEREQRKRAKKNGGK